MTLHFTSAWCFRALDSCGFERGKNAINKLPNFRVGFICCWKKKNINTVTSQTEKLFLTFQMVAHTKNRCHRTWCTRDWVVL